MSATQYTQQTQLCENISACVQKLWQKYWETRFMELFLEKSELFMYYLFKSALFKYGLLSQLFHLRLSFSFVTYRTGYLYLLRLLGGLNEIEQSQRCM